MSALIKIPYPSSSDGTLVNAYKITAIEKLNNDSLSIHIGGGTKIALTNTTDSTTNTLKAFNVAWETALSIKSRPSVSVPVTMPSGISVTSLQVELLPPS